MALSWIDESDLHQAFETAWRQIQNAQSETDRRRRRNVEDPFRSSAIAALMSMDSSDDLESALRVVANTRSVEDTIGDMHENIIGNIPGWKLWDAGYDVRNDSKKILAEIKNKHNTLNSTNERGVIQELDVHLRGLQGWTGYLVNIIPRRPERFKQDVGNTGRLYKVDGATFYTIATGEYNALQQLYKSWNEWLKINENVSQWLQSQSQSVLPG